MDNESVAPQDDDETSVPEQDATTDAQRPSLFSSTRASRIRQSLSQGRFGSGKRPGTGTSGNTSPMDPDATLPAGQARTARAAGRVAPRTYAHIIAGFCYLGMPVVPVAVLFSPAHRFARFHALQALGLFVPLATLSYLLSVLTPTSILPGILYTILVLAIVGLALLWMAVAIAAFEGYALTLPLLEQLIPTGDDLQEDSIARTPQSTLLVLATAVGASLLLLVLTLILPLSHWFSTLSVKNLAPLGLRNGLPVWMVVSALLQGLIFAAVGLVLLAVFLLGLRKGKFFPAWASWGAVAGAAITAAGTGLLIADSMQRSLTEHLTQQFDSSVNDSAIPRTATIGTKTLLPQVTSGLNSLHTLSQAQSNLLLPGALLLVLGLAMLTFLLSQLYYKQ